MGRCAAGVVLTLLSARAGAATKIWDGRGSNANWSNGANWFSLGLGTPPANDGTADIVMTGSRFTSVVDQAWDVNSLSFSTGPFLLSGSLLEIQGGGVTNNATAEQRIMNDIGINATQTWNAAAGPLRFDEEVRFHPLIQRTLTITGDSNTSLLGAISGRGTLIKNGNGTLTFSAIGNNSYTGATTVNGGTLLLSRLGVAIPGDLTINNATVRMNTSTAQISTVAGNVVTINGGGVLDLNGFNHTVGDVVLEGGQIQTGAGVVTLSRDIVVNASGAGSTISGNMNLGGTRTFAVPDGAAVNDLTITAKLTGINLVKSGPGTLFVGGSSANEVHTILVNDGRVVLGKTSGRAVESMIVGDGVGAPGSAVGSLAASGQFSVIDPPGENFLTILEDGVFEMNGLSSFTRALALRGGTLNTGSGEFQTPKITAAAAATSAVIAGRSLKLSHVPEFAGLNTFFLTVADGAAADDLVIDARIDFDNPLNQLEFVKATGGGQLVLRGGTRFAQRILVDDATLVLDSPTPQAFFWTEVAAFNGGTLRFRGDQQIVDGVSVGLGPGGLVDLNGRSQTIRELTFGAPAGGMTGAVATGAGLLTVNERVVLQTASGAVISGRLALGGSEVVVDTGAAAAGPNLIISAAIESGALTIVGAGLLRYEGSAANTTGGTTTVNAGTLVLAKSVADGAIRGPLVIGDGQGGANADVARLAGNEQILAANPVIINQSGLLDLDGFNETLQNLTMAGGTLRGGAGAGATLVMTGTISHTGQTTSTISANVDLAGGTRALDVVNGASAVDLDVVGTVGNGGIRKAGLGTLRLGGAGANPRLESLKIDDGRVVLAPGADRTLDTKSLTLDPSDSGLDLTNGRLIVRADAASRDSVKSSVSAWVKLAHDSGWGGPGVGSSSAATDPQHASAVGVILNDAGGGQRWHESFGGEPVDENSILARYTLLGDGNLDGVVSFADFQRLERAFGRAGTWIDGDGDYDGDVDGADFLALFGNFGRAAGAPAGAHSAADRAALEAFAAAHAVPEPAGMAWLAAGAVVLGRRRRR